MTAGIPPDHLYSSLGKTLRFRLESAVSDGEFGDYLSRVRHRVLTAAAAGSDIDLDSVFGDIRARFDERWPDATVVPLENAITLRLRGHD